MNKSEFAQYASDSTGYPKYRVSEALDVIRQALAECLASGDVVKINGLGTFSIKLRAARKGRSPITGEAVTIPPKYVIHFVPGKDLSDAVEEFTDNQRRKGRII